MNASPPTAACARCGTVVAANALKGLCPRCLMELNLVAPTEVPCESGQPGADPSRPLPTPEEVAKHFPQFQILECLGRGGMGVVYKARQPKLNRMVALKILAPEKEAQPKFAERFEREAQALARLNHPNIVTVYDFGQTDGLYYLTMEFVDGVSLRRLLQTRRMEPAEALAIVPKICEALQYAHDEGVVHRDIKPENLLLDKKGRVKIADFGIAKIVAGEAGGGSSRFTTAAPGEGGAADTARAASGLTQEQMLGTPNYMAPEQREHPQKVDHRADIYSLGVVFYEMLTGELPIGKFAPPSQRVHVDVRLDEVVLHALEKEPALRYQQASQVKTAVEMIAHSPPPRSGSTSAGKGRGLRLGLACGAIALTALVAIAGLIYMRSHRAPARTRVVIDLGAGINMEFVLIRPGSFTMGSDRADETPVHKVTISKPFYLGKYEVTQEQWELLMQTNHSLHQGPKLPVTKVSWAESEEFLKRLEEWTGHRFALPTEAQWEYACRAGTRTAYSFGNSDADLEDYAWFAANSQDTTHPVGEKKPNPWGLYDMHGNAWERCADGFESYPAGPATDPKRGTASDVHVTRGGGWTTPANGLRSSNRGSDMRGDGHIGLRCVMLLDGVAQVQAQTGEQYIQRQLKLAGAGNYWAKYNLWDAYSRGKHGVARNPAEAARLLPDLVKGVYLAKFEPANDFYPGTPQEILKKFYEHSQLFSWKNRLGGAGFFRTKAEGDKLIGSFLTSAPDKFKAALQKNPDLKLISIEPVTPEMFLAHEAAPQESL